MLNERLEYAPQVAAIDGAEIAERLSCFEVIAVAPLAAARDALKDAIAVVGDLPVLPVPVHRIIDGGVPYLGIAVALDGADEEREALGLYSIAAEEQGPGKLEVVGGARVAATAVVANSVRRGAVQLGSWCRMHRAIERVAVEPVDANNVAGKVRLSGWSRHGRHPWGGGAM